MWRMLPIIALGAVIACASGSGTSGTNRGADCEPVPEDLSVGGLRVYRECSVSRAARPVGATPRMQYTPSGSNSCARAIVDVVVDTTGRTVPSTVRTVRSTDAGFLEALLATLDARRYEPAVRDGLRVPQIVRIDVGVSVRRVVVSSDGPVSGAQRRPSVPRC